MLSESFYVRRVVKTKNPETGEIQLESDPEGELGVARSFQVVQIPDQTSPLGMKTATVLGVSWEKSNYPAIVLTDPDDVEHMDDFLEGVIDRFKQDYGNEFLEKSISALLETYGPEAVFAELREQLSDGDEEEEEEETDEASEEAQAASTEATQ